jgi:phasin family protein
MFSSPEQFVALQRRYLESAQAIAMASFAGFEKLTELNVQAAKASMEESVQRSISLLESKDAKALTDTFTESAKPPGDKFTAYAKHVYDIASETRAEISKVLEDQFSEGNRQLVASLESMAKNSPVSSDGVVTMVKSAITAANATWGQVSKVSHQVAETTDATVENATNEVLNAATTSSRQVRR